MSVAEQGPRKLRLKRIGMQNDFLPNNIPLQGPRKTRLRSLANPMNSNVIPEEIIQQNLQPLIINSEKKKRAQEFYYENSDNEIGSSPMLRRMKRPVKQRLGNKMQFTGTNTSLIPPKRRLRKLNPTLNNSINKRRNLAQTRLNLIRARQRFELDQMGSNTLPKRIKLRRPGAINGNMLRIEVPNNHVNLLNNQSFNNSHFRHRQILNSVLQAEIKDLERTRISQPLTFQFRFSPVATKLPMHDRFASLI